MVIGWSNIIARQHFHNYYNWEGSYGSHGEVEEVEEASGEGDVLDEPHLDLEMNQQEILSDRNNNENIVNSDDSLEKEHFIKVDERRNKHEGATIIASEVTKHRETETTEKVQEINDNFNFTLEDGELRLSDDFPKKSSEHEGMISLSNSLTESSSSITIENTTEVDGEYFTKEVYTNNDSESVYQHEEEESSVTKRPDTILYTNDKNITNIKDDHTEKQLEITEITTETTSTPSPPSPLCITRSGDRKAPYVFSLSPLPPRSHVQYTFTTLDMKGNKSYQNIALTIRGTKGNGRGGTQFVHTRGGRRGVVTLGPGNTGLYVRVLSHTHTAKWSFTACVLQR